MKAILKKLFLGQSLSATEAEAVMDKLLASQAAPEEIGAFLGALHVRGEKTEELVGFLASLRKHAVPFPLASEGLIDCCGTGGDASGTFNISTAAALVVAAAGGKVAKHGNRSVSSKSGSADVLEVLGIPTDLSPKDAAQEITDHGFAFLFAPKFYPALAAVSSVRKNLGVRTVFNLLGPLANPARVQRQVMGVPEIAFIERIAQVLQQSGSIEAMVVSSEDGLDELSIAAPTRVAHLKAGKIGFIKLVPEDFGLKRSPLSDLRGGEAAENAAIIEKILDAEPGAKRDVVVLNAAASIWVGGLASGPCDAALLAAKTIDSGQAKSLLTQLRRKR